jgi:hypothetical protein
MEDSNLIACLYPCGELAWNAIRMRENRTVPERGSRASTVKDDDEPTKYPGLQLTFNPGPKAGQGLVMGRDTRCDIVLLNLDTISRRHCVLTFDTER